MDHNLTKQNWTVSHIRTKNRATGACYTGGWMGNSSLDMVKEMSHSYQVVNPHQHRKQNYNKPVSSCKEIISILTKYKTAL